MSLKISPDGSRIGFLRGKEASKDCLDLWEFHVDSGTERLLIDSADLASHDKALSEAEKARRERQRTAALSGIVDYAYLPSGDGLLVPLAGALFHCRLRPQQFIYQIPASGAVTDPSVSPDGRHLAYINAQDLFVFDIERAEERALTADGGASISNGMAEFVAQEEMDRSSGYWWSPDSKLLAFIRVDESNVTEAVRFEISGEEIETYIQRYPAAGSRNASLRVGVVEIESGAVTWMDIGNDADIYIARVDWLPSSSSLAIQRQSRDQKTLELLFCDVTSGKSRLILTESSNLWVDLHHELTFLKNSPHFIWASNRTGFTHLYLYHTDASLLRELTHGEWSVDNFRDRAIRCVDESEGAVYFMSTAKTPLERHLYRVSLHDGDIQQITRDAGIHVVAMSPTTKFYVDNFNSASQPPRVGLYDRSGRLRNWLFENRLDVSHPGAPYLATNAITEFGELTAVDGQKLQYRLFKPHDFDAKKSYPAIIEVYGGPGVQRVLNTWQGSTFTQILTRAGYVVMMLDNRGSAHRGTLFQCALSGQLGKIEVDDQLTGAHWLGSQSYIDPARLGVWGWSYGGYLTLMLMFRSRAFKAGVSGAPVTDWRLYDSHYTERYLGMPSENEEGYRSSSVIPYAEQSEGSLLVMHGMADDNVLFTHTTRLLRRLQDLRKPFEVMVYPGGKHGLLRTNDGRHAYGTMLSFFQRALGQ